MPPRLPKETPGRKYRQIWAWLGMPGDTQPKGAALYATFS